MSFLKTMALGATIQINAGSSAATVAAVSRSLDQMINKGKIIGPTMQIAGRGMLAMAAAGGALALGMTAALRKGVEFEAGMASLKSHLEPDEWQDLPKLGNMARDWGVKTGLGASKALAGIEELAKAGLKGDLLEGAVPATLRMAVSTDKDPTAVAEGIVHSMRQFRLETGDEISLFADQLAKADNMSAASMDDILRGMGNVGAVAHQFNLAPDQVLSSVAVLQDAGVGISESGTALKTMLLRSAAPTKKAAEVMTKYGIATRDAKGNLLDIPGLLAQIQNGLKKAKGTAGKAEVLNTLFGLRGIKAASQLTEAFESGRFQEMNTALQGAAGALETMVDARLDSLPGQMQIFKALLQEVSIQMTGMFGPAFKETFKEINAAFIQFVAGLKGADGTAIEKFGNGFAAGLQLVVDGFKFVKAIVQEVAGSISERLGGDGLKTLGMVVSVVSVLLAVLSPVTATLGLLLMAFSGIGETVVMVGAAIGVFSWLISQLTIDWEHMKTIAVYTFVRILRIFRPTVAILKSIWNDFVSNAQAWFSKLSEHSDTLVESLSQIVIWIAKASSFFLNLGLIIIKAFMAIGTFVVPKIIDAFITLIEFLGKVARKFNTVFGGTGKSLFGDEMMSVLGGIQDLENFGHGIKVENDKGKEEQTGFLDNLIAKGKAAVAAPEIANSVTVNDKRCLHLNNELKIAGEPVAAAVSKHHIELAERTGATINPWQKRAALERGATLGPATVVE